MYIYIYVYIYICIVIVLQVGVQRSSVMLEKFPYVQFLISHEFLEVSMAMGVPQNGWFIIEDPTWLVVGPPL